MREIAHLHLTRNVVLGCLNPMVRPSSPNPLLAKLLVALGVGLSLALGAGRANAESPPSPTSLPKAGTYWHLMAFEALGDSLRFNNPYRLANQLGSTGESLSRTPVYNSLGAAVAAGNPNGFQQGFCIQWSRAWTGLPQHVLTPSYLAMLGGWRPWLPYGRVGLPIVLNPDANVGGEIALGTTYLLLAGIGLHVELIGDLFYGAATWTTGRTTIPLLSLQAGITIDYEVLP